MTTLHRIYNLLRPRRPIEWAATLCVCFCSFGIAATAIALPAGQTHYVVGHKHVKANPIAHAALDAFQAADKWDVLTHDSCGNGTTWVCFSREHSNCGWVSHNYFYCTRFWVETQFGVNNQEQEGYGHLYYVSPGVWASSDYRVKNIG